MKRFLSNLKYWFDLVETVRQAEKDIENLETKLLAPEEVVTTRSIWTAYLDWGFDGRSRTISLEEKVEALAKALNVRFKETEATDSGVIAVVEKKKKRKSK